MRADRVAQPAAQLLEQLGLVVVAQLSERYWSGPRVALQLHAPGLPDEQVAGRQLAALVEDRERCRDRVEGEEGLETVEVELAARQRSQLRREGELGAVGTVVERLDAEAVTGEDESPAARVPDCDREHSTQPACEVRVPLLVRVHEHLGVAVGPETMARAFELAAQVLVVVDLTVLHDVARTVLVRDRLVAGLEIDDRETPGGEADTGVDVLTDAVGTAVGEGGAHRAQPVGIDRAPGRDSADSTHGLVLYGRIDWRRTRQPVATTVRR